MRRFLPVVAFLVLIASSVQLRAQTRVVKPTSSKIEDGLFLGGFVETPPEGVKAVLNVCEAKNNYKADFSRFAPIRNSAPAPSLDWLRDQVAFVDDHRRADRPVYVHCAVGMSRSGMVVVAYLMQRDGPSRDDALKTVQRQREMVKPNPAFLDLLAAWETDLKKRKPVPKSK